MIVKNEEEMLPRCLNSIKHLIDELIIVDTGSTDKTIEIAESFGAKIYHHPWENNFSKHRNQSLGYATGDWIIQIDADEELNGYQLKKNVLKKMFANAPKNLHCFLIKMLDKNKKGETVSETEMLRIFRNHVGVHFTGIVHNRPQYSGKVGHSDIQFFHYGYALSDAQMQAKYKRTSGLLFKRIEEDPQDHDAYFYLYQVHSEMNEKKKAVEYAEKCLGLIKEKNINLTEASFYYSLYHGLASTYLKSGHYELAQSFVRKGLEVLPDEPDLYYDLAAIGYFSGKPSVSVEGGKNYLRVIDGFRKDPLKAGTRFIFTASKKAELSVSFWLMSGLISLNQLDAFLALWEQYKEEMIDTHSFQKQLFEALENKDAFECIEPVANYLFNNLNRIPVENHKMVLSYFLFYFKEKIVSRKAPNGELDDMFEGVASQYLETVKSYQEIPTGEAVILADFLLDKNMENFFWDLTSVVFARELSGQIKKIDSNKTIMQGYGLIAENQNKTRKGQLFKLLCKNICEKLGVTDSNKSSETASETVDPPVAASEDREGLSGQLKPGIRPFSPDNAGRKVGATILKKDRIPKVTIGLPVYNGGQALSQAIKSILAQDFGDFELIISDNCSTDNTEEICCGYADNDDRIYYTRTTHNHGLAASFSNLVGLARSEFFIFAQHDNTFDHKYITTCLKAFEADVNKSYAIVFPQVRLINQNGSPEGSQEMLNAVQESPVERYLHVLETLGHTSPILGLMRTAIIKNCRISLGALSSRSSNTIYTDYATATEIALKGKIRHISQMLLNSKMSDDNDDLSLEERTVRDINAVAPHIMNDGISFFHIGIIRRQMDVINYAPISFSEKQLLIKETVKVLTSRFQDQMLDEIRRALGFVKNKHFFVTWAGQRLPEDILDSLPDFKRLYMTMLSREFEDALLYFPELDGLKAAVQLCRDQIRMV